MVEKSEVIRHDIERTRAEMDDTLDALGYKINVPARARGWFGRKTDTLTGLCSMGITKAAAATDSMVSRVSGGAPSSGDIQRSASSIKDTAERNPMGLTLAGAAAGFIAGLFAPSTQIENEKLGPLADDVKSQAIDAGHEALEHGKHVAEAAAQSAVDTAKTEAKQHGEELSSTLQEKTREVAPSSA